MGTRAARWLSRNWMSLCGMAAATAAAVLSVNRPLSLAAFDSRIYDTLTRWAPSQPATGRIVIVDVDDDGRTSVGAWTFRHDVVAPLLRRIHDAGPAVTVLEGVLAEPESDVADVLRQGRAVVGYEFAFDDESDQNGCVVHPLGLDVAPAGKASGLQLLHASRATCGPAWLSKAAGASGFVNAPADADAVIRRAPLLVAYEDRVYPSLALAAVMTVANSRAATLRVSDAKASLMLGREEVPLDDKGNLLLNYRVAAHGFTHIAASDVLASRISADRFADKVVIVSATAPGDGDLVTTPLARRVTSVEVHATMAENLLQADFISRPESARAIETAMTLGLGFLIVLLTTDLGVLMASAIGVLCIVMFWAGAEWLLVAQRVYVSPLVATLGGVLTMAVTAIAVLTQSRVSLSTENRPTHAKARIA